MSDPSHVQDPFAGERPKLSPFHPRLAALNVREAWSSWNGVKFADYFYDVEYEYFCIRNLCGTYDISPMQKYEISGPDAEAMLDRMVTRDVTKFRVNRVSYCVWCTDEGRIIDDGTIFRLGEQRYMLTCGSPSLAWLRKSCLGFDEVEVRDVTEETAALSVQGPTSCSVLKRMGLEDIETCRPFEIRYFPFQGTTLMVSRTGFTGDLGYELWIDAEHALAMWDALYAAGEDFGIQPYGETATNMARLEAAFIMPDAEFSEALKTVNFEHDQTPFDLDLGWLVDFKKPHFSGRAALLEAQRKGPAFKLTKLDIAGNRPAEGSHVYRDKACTREIGYVTSAMWSPVAKANIALAVIDTRYLDAEMWVEIYYEKELRHHSRIERCKTLDGPFLAPPHARKTPALLY